MVKYLSVLAVMFALCACSTTAITENTLDQAAASSVYVRVGDATGDFVPHGSGTVIAKNIVLTAGHVAFDDEKQIHVKTAYNVEQLVTNKDVTKDESIDFALLDVDTGNTPAIKYSCAKFPIGTEVFAYGNPLGLKDVATFGRIASNRAPSYKGAPKDAILVDLTAAPGVSGGGLFTIVNNKPILIGIVVQIVRGYTYTIAIPLSAFCDKLPK